MDTRLKKHAWYYSSLAVILLLGFWLILATSYSKQLQMTAIVLTASVYLFWSLLHQYIHHSLPAKIVVEYVLIASLGLTISLFLFNI